MRPRLIKRTNEAVFDDRPQRRGYQHPPIPAASSRSESQWTALIKEVRFAPNSPLEESGFEPSVPLGEKRSFRNASIRELHRAAYRGGRKRYRRRRPSGSRRSDHSNTATASELQVRPVG